MNILDEILNNTQQVQSLIYLHVILKKANLTKAGKNSLHNKYSFHYNLYIHFYTFKALYTIHRLVLSYFIQRLIDIIIL